MPIEHERIKRDIAAISVCTLTPDAGASRPTFSGPWRAARDYVIGELVRIGCRVRVDAIGNVHARPAGVGWEEPVWMSGSHLDTVPHGGNYDGVIGVVVPLELMRAAHDDGREQLPLELVIFTEEEGTTFGLGLLGSRTWTGELSAEDLSAVTNDDGQNYFQAGEPHGVQPDDIPNERISADSIRGFVEVHAEQGPGLWRRQQTLAVVNAVAGRRQYRCRLVGLANHAGATSMIDRQDALAGAADVMIQLEALARKASPQTALTVGQIRSRPNAVNVVPGEVEFSIDFRSPDDDVMRKGHNAIHAIVKETAERRRLAASIEMKEALTAVGLDSDLCDCLIGAAERAGLGTVPVTASGALHDTAILAPHVPAAMLFVSSKDGISHNPEEFSRTEDVMAAAEVLWEVVSVSV